MKEKDLTDLGFARYDLDDEVLLKQTGNSGHVYGIEFKQIGRSITTGLIESGKKITFFLCDLDGNILKELKSKTVTDKVETAKVTDQRMARTIKVIQKELER